MAADSSTSAQRRRATKPLIEKRRRARINCSLAQLKEMVAKPSQNTQESRSNRLEKADILEMTVDFVKSLQNNAEDGEICFEEGYRLCMNEVQNFFCRNYQKQAPEHHLGRSLHSHLRQVLLERTAEALARRGCSKRKSPDAEENRRQNDEFLSDFGSGASTDDEVSENCTRAELAVNYHLRAQSRLNGVADDVTVRRNFPCDRNVDVHANDRMWRPW